MDEEEVEAEDASLVDDAPVARVGQLTAKEMVASGGGNQKTAAPGPAWKLHNGGGGLNSH